jgi:alpha-glucosidase
MSARNTSARPWWSGAVFYQVYPRSFADGNGDGDGDLIGLTQRLGYLAELGVDAVWLSPFYPSPMADGGYDVADPCDVDPRFGTLDDFDTMTAEAHRLGLRVIVDIVPNHFSEQHPWFQAALAACPGSPERDRFIFRPGRGSGGDRPPNNWPSVFGGQAWTRLADGQWYLHLFAPEQPDLNWENPEVRAEFARIVRFWLDRGADGFRVDVAHGMAKPDGLPDLEPEVLAEIGELIMPSARDVRWDRDRVHDYHRGLRRVLGTYPGDRMAVGEAWVPDAERLARYVRPGELNLAFNFELVEASWGAGTFAKAIDRSLEAMARVGAPCTWVLANHDVRRTVTRYGGGAMGLARARAALLVMLSLPGAAFVYNGDELGLPNVDLPDDALQDPTWERSGHTERGRDGQRVPLPWSGAAPPFGFSSTPDTWLPMPASWARLTVEAQRDDADSTLNLCRTALRLRRDLPADGFAWLDAPVGALSYRRGTVTVVLNAGPEPMPLPGRAEDVLLRSAALGRDDHGKPTVPANTAVWLRPG